MSKTSSNPTKEKILHCAAEVFLRHGFENTTVRMIAEQAEVNLALINYHYGDKATLYLEVVRYWARDAFQNYPLNLLDDPDIKPKDKIKAFIYHTLVCLFGPEGKGTGFGRLLIQEAIVNPSDVVHDIVLETISRPTEALSVAVAQVTGIRDARRLHIYTACIVGQTVYFYLSRHLTAELFEVTAINCDEDIRELSDAIFQFSMASLNHLKEIHES